LAGTLPDLDILYSFFTNDVGRLVAHRGLTHSFFLAPLAAYLLAPLFARLAARTGLSRRQWFWLFFWCFMTHIVIDLVTVYGTQVFYPFTRYPYALSSMFIIDPFYAFPLIGGVLYFLLSRTALRRRRRVLIAVVSLTTFYIITAIVFRTYADHRFAAALDEQSIDYARIETFSSPFNIVMWRAAVITADANLSAWYSLWSPNEAIVFTRTPAHPQRQQLDSFATADSDVAKLRRFSKGFYRYQEHADGIAWIDLRFVAGDVYPFRYLVAARNDAGELYPLQTARRLAVGERPPVSTIFTQLYEQL